MSDETRTRRLGRNEVPGCDGWFYGLKIRHEDGTRTVDVAGPSGQVITLERVPLHELNERAQKAIEASS